MLFKYRDIRTLPNLGSKHLLYRKSGRVGDVNDASSAVTAFPRQVVVTALSAEWNALINQPFDRASTIFDHESRCGEIIEEGACRQRILDVCFNRILIVEHGGDAALSPS